MFFAQEACWHDFAEAQKKEPRPTETPEVAKPELSLFQADAITGDLRGLQAQRQPDFPTSYQQRLESIAITDPAEWLRWMHKGDVPPEALDYITRLEQGDLVLESIVTQLRMEMGL